MRIPEEGAVDALREPAVKPRSAPRQRDAEPRARGEADRTGRLPSSGQDERQLDRQKDRRRGAQQEQQHHEAALDEEYRALRFSRTGISSTR